LPDYEKMLINAAEKAQGYKNKIEQLGYVEHAFKSIVPDLRDYRDNTNSTERRYCFYGLEDESFRRSELTVSTYERLHCDMELSDLSIDTAIKIMALIRETP